MMAITTSPTQQKQQKQQEHHNNNNNNNNTDSVGSGTNIEIEKPLLLELDEMNAAKAMKLSSNNYKYNDNDNDNDDSTNFTKSTTSLSGSSGWSNSTLTMAPLNDLRGESSHSHRSRRGSSNSNSNSYSSSLGGSSHHSRRSSQSNSLGGSSHHTRGSCELDRSVGECSLSSFLSVLLEEEETRPQEISIVPDNPRPEKRSVQELRLSFIRSAYKNNRPKDRWEYLTRDNNDREQMSKMKRRSKLEIRSSSFSGPISNSKHMFSNTNSSGSPTTSPNDSFDFDGKSRSKNTANMFLRMPQRKDSPLTEAVGKKSIMSRCVNMSDTDLIILPMQPGSTPTPSSSSKKKKTVPSENRGISRNRDHNANTGNATWSNADMRKQRMKNSNQFLEFLLEPEGDSKSYWPSPLPSPPSDNQRSSLTAARTNSLQVSDRHLAELSNSFFSLDYMSDEEVETEEEKGDDDDDDEVITAPVKRMFISTPPLANKPHGTVSSISAIQRKNDEKCSSRPPQIPTRYRGSPMKSPEQIKERRTMTPPPPPPPLIQAGPNLVVSPTAKSPPPVTLRKTSEK